MLDAQCPVALQNIGVALAEVGFDGKCLAVNRAFCELLGRSPQQLCNARFDALFPIAAGQPEDNLRRQFVSNKISHYSSERNAICADGTLRQVRITFTLNGENSRRSACMLASVEDLTELRSTEAALKESEIARHELARRLTNAQEKERTRIARELHDDIGQSLAILRIQMLRAGQPVSGMLGKRHPTIPELCNNLKSLAEKVSRISHQLHSSELEYLGLAVAIESHCREFSEKQKIAVECICTDIPEDLDSLLALSILRIVQEALHNAGKHSKAKSIQVAVEASGGELSLLVADDGIGFDLEEAKLAAGLGLISMRERVHLAGGEFKISSQPGEGTCISARVPLSGIKETDI